MKVLSGVYWSAGGTKESNQDSVTLQQVMTPRGRICLAMVCDGIGGLPGGEVASGYVAEEISRWFYEEGVPKILRRKTGKQLIRSLLREFFRIGEDLQRYGKRNELNIGTTVTVLMIWKRRYLSFHLGDSRLYLCRRKARQLTVDHNNRKGALTKCINSYFWQKPDILQGRVLSKCGFLLCTDGFYNRIGIRQLTEAFFPWEIREEKQIEARLREVAVHVVKKGEKDNISAIFVKVT